MPETLYDVVYIGEIIAPNRQQVIENFAATFKLTPEKAAAILSDSRRVLKKGVSEVEAQQYVKKLSAIGLLVNAEPQAIDIEALITLEPESPQRAGEDGLTAGSDDQTDSAVAADNTEAGSDSESGDTAGSPDPDQTEDANTYPRLDAASLSVEQPEQPAVGATNFAMIEDTSKVKRLKFSFTGTGAEFFKIWIVNIALSIVTLGIYSAWAKVRTNQYFYGNTWLDKASFEYLANPVAILKGRVIAVLFFVVYSLAQQWYPLLSPILVALFLLMVPWLVSRSLRFRMRNTAYRNIRFGFEGSMWGAAKAYSLLFLLTPFTLGLLIPYMLYAQNRYFIDDSRYGVDQFSFGASPREYYRIYITAILTLLGVGLLGGLFLMTTPVMAGLIFVGGYSLFITYIKVNITNLMFDGTHLGDHQFNSSLELWPYFQLYFVNAILMVLTLGLFYPWAKVRIAKYRAEHTLLLAQGSLNNYVAVQEQEISAIGEELGDVFDIDIGF